ncbi:CoA transferase [Chloroflexota bacterium]
MTPSLEPILNEAMAKRATEEWIVELEQLGISCGPVNNIEQVANDPQIAARDMIIEAGYAKAGKLKVVNTPFKFSRTPSGKARQFAPELREHTGEILRERLAMSEHDIDNLREAGII